MESREDLVASILQELIIYMRILTKIIQNWILHYGDLTDSTNLIRVIQQVQPDEIYNLGAQSLVYRVSFKFS